MSGDRDDGDGRTDVASDDSGDDPAKTDADDGPLGAAWGGGDGDAGGGPSPRPEELRGDEPDRPGAPTGDGELRTIDRITIFLQAHKTAFTISLLVYALLVMPWLYREGFEVVGFALGAAFLGGAVLVTVANAHEAREELQGGDERRGF